MHLPSDPHGTSDTVLPNTETVRYAVGDHVATVTIDRSPRLNAMDLMTDAALSEAWTRIRTIRTA